MINIYSQNFRTLTLAVATYLYFWIKFWGIENKANFIYLLIKNFAAPNIVKTNFIFMLVGLHGEQAFKTFW